MRNNILNLKGVPLRMANSDVNKTSRVGDINLKPAATSLLQSGKTGTVRQPAPLCSPASQLRSQQCRLRFLRAEN